MMEPVVVERKNDAYTLVHRCVVCGAERRNKTAKDDDVDALITIAKKEADSVAFRYKI